MNKSISRRLMAVGLAFAAHTEASGAQENPPQPAPAQATPKSAALQSYKQDPRFEHAFEVATPELAKAKGKALAEEDFAQGKYRCLGCIWLSRSCHNVVYPINVDYIEFGDLRTPGKPELASAGEEGYNGTMLALLKAKFAIPPAGK